MNKRRGFIDSINIAVVEALRAVVDWPELRKNTERGRRARRDMHSCIASYSRITLASSPNDVEIRGFVLGLITAVMISEAGKGRLA